MLRIIEDRSNRGNSGQSTRLSLHYLNYKMKRIVFLFIFVTITFGAFQLSAAELEGPEIPYQLALNSSGPSEDSRALTFSRHDSQSELRNALMQRWGYILFGTGLVAALAGVVLVEIDPYDQAIGKPGFVTLGAGIGVMTAGMFLLGFSRPETYYKVRPAPSRRR